MPIGCNMCNSHDSLALVACLFISVFSSVVVMSVVVFVIALVSSISGARSYLLKHIKDIITSE